MVSAKPQYLDCRCNALSLDPAVLNTAKMAICTTNCQHLETPLPSLQVVQLLRRNPGP